MVAQCRQGLGTGRGLECAIVVGGQSVVRSSLRIGGSSSTIRISAASPVVSGESDIRAFRRPASYLVRFLAVGGDAPVLIRLLSLPPSCFITCFPHCICTTRRAAFEEVRSCCVLPAEREQRSIDWCAGSSLSISWSKQGSTKMPLGGVRDGFVRELGTLSRRSLKTSSMRSPTSPIELVPSGRGREGGCPQHPTSNRSGPACVAV